MNNLNFDLKTNDIYINGNMEENDIGLQRLFREPRRPRTRQPGLGLQNVAGLGNLFQEPIERRPRGRPRKNPIVEQKEEEKQRQRRGEWSQQTKNIREDAIRLGFNVNQTGRKLTKDNRNVWQQFIDNRTRQRPFIRDIQEWRFALRPTTFDITGFTQISGWDNERFQAGERAYRLNARGLQTMSLRNFIETQAQILNMINILIRNFVRMNRLRPNDALVLQVESPDLNSPIFIRTKVKDVSSTQLFDRIRQFLQSAEFIDLSTSIFVFRYVRGREGGAFRSNASKDDIYKKKAVIKQVYNTDEKVEDCFFQCIVLGLAELNIKLEKYQENEVSFDALTCTRTDKYKKRAQKQREKLSKQLSEYIGIELKAVSFTDIETFEKKFNLNINVIDINGLQCIYPNLYDEKVLNSQGANQLYFLYSEHIQKDGTIIGHYDYIVKDKINALYNAPFFCHKCKKSYTTKYEHKCIEKCFHCWRPDCDNLFKDGYKQELLNVYEEKLPESVVCNILSFIYTKFDCKDCGFSFNTQMCYENHKQRRCKKIHYCSKCKKSYNVVENDKHMCGLNKCKNCGAKVKLNDHKCYHRVLTEYDIFKTNVQKQFNIIKEEQNESEAVKWVNSIPYVDRYQYVSDKYIFFDIETFPLKDEVKGLVHIPYLVIASTSLSDNMFKFNNVSEFVDWFTETEIVNNGGKPKEVYKYSGYTLIAHNGKGYDNIFIKKELVKRCIISEDICNGNKIMYMNLNKHKIRFVDSLSFIARPLKDFPYIFGLDTSKFSKDFFPHSFLEEDEKNLYYEGRIPDKKYFKNQVYEKDFDKWYSSFDNKTYNLLQEAESYCKQDVIVLKQGCMEFRKIILELTGYRIDPWRTITIAGLSQLVYRLFDMPERSIAVLEDNFIKHSNEEIEWIDYLRSTGISIPKQQYKITIGSTSYFVDGYNPESNTVYEYNGCYFHGCESCYNRYTQNSINMKYMKDLYSDWERKKQALLDNGYKVVEMWSHEWMYKRKNDQEIKEFLKTYENNNMFLDPRDAFFGGLTQPTKLYKKVKDNERIRYIDFTSLYPTINYCRARGFTRDTQNDVEEWFYPIGHPVRFRDNFGDINQYFGFIKCKITPPKNLYCPILPERNNETGKLIFHLNTMTGTWTTEEVKYAISKGYKIEKIYEIEHFNQKSNTLFTSYVQRFFGLKQENAGWNKLKKDAGTDWRHDLPENEARKEYIKMFYNTTGIKLNYNNIPEQTNDGMYFVAKLFCNSLWGKYGQKDNFTNTKTVYDRNSFCDIVFNDQYESNFIFLSENAVSISYKKIEETLSAPTLTNIAIASYTTSYARLKLLKALDILGDRVLYMDTDSIVFVDELDSENQWKSGIITGFSLGDFTDELGNDTYITEFVSTGPKSYAYKTNNGKKDSCKVKGFRLKDAPNINFDSIKELVVNDDKRNSKIQVKPLQFKINKYYDITTSNEIKQFGFTFDKREIDYENITEYEINTLPFGYMN